MASRNAKRSEDRTADDTHRAGRAIEHHRGPWHVTAHRTPSSKYASDLGTSLPFSGRSDFVRYRGVNGHFFAVAAGTVCDLSLALHTASRQHAAGRPSTIIVQQAFSGRANRQP